MNQWTSDEFSTFQEWTRKGGRVNRLPIGREGLFLQIQATNSSIMKYFSFALVVCFLALTFLEEVQCEKKKLQIGVKKKVENCPRRSRKGDVLHMHYTVRFHLLLPVHLYLCFYIGLKPVTKSFIKWQHNIYGFSCSICFYFSRANWKMEQSLIAVYQEEIH